MLANAKLKNLTQRELVAFDFDQTIVKWNTDTWIYELSPSGSLPDELRFRSGQDWRKHVQDVLKYLHSHGITEKDYHDCLSEMPTVPGMIEELIVPLKNQSDNYDMIIISDSNSFFIESVLKSKGLENVFANIYTNGAKFNDDGLLLVTPYHDQDFCKLCPRNLCKGEVLKNFIGNQMLKMNTVYTCVNYIGDGENDFCPSSKLSDRDRVFPREGFALNRICASKKEETSVADSVGTVKDLPDLKASVVSWSNGKQIFDVITGSATLV